MNKNIYVFVEQRDGKIQKVAYELIGKAKELADQIDQNVVAMLVGSDISFLAEDIISRGADEVVIVEDKILAEYVTEPYAKAVSSIIVARNPEIVLYGATSIGRDLAPRVSARIHTGLTADCTSLDIDEETKEFLMTRPAFGGNIMATIVCPDFRPQMATVRPGVMKALDADDTRVGKIERLDVKFTDNDMNIKIIDVKKSVKETVDITEAKILVSGGRGLGSPDGFKKLESLADAFGGQISSSRANVDAGWISHDKQVGQTGKTVRPNLYVACGISGAIQHLAGMEGSDYILAINNDEDASIFDVSDLGIVGDLNIIVPKLEEAVRKYKEEAK